MRGVTAELDWKVSTGQGVGNPVCTDPGWRNGRKGPVVEFREQGGSKGQWQDEAGEVNMMLWPLRSLEFMVGGSNQTPGLRRKILTLAPPLLAEGSLGLVDRSV